MRRILCCPIGALKTNDHFSKNNQIWTPESISFETERMKSVLALARPSFFLLLCVFPSLRPQKRPAAAQNGVPKCRPQKHENCFPRGMGQGTELHKHTRKARQCCFGAQGLSKSHVVVRARLVEFWFFDYGTVDGTIIATLC